MSAPGQPAEFSVVVLGTGDGRFTVAVEGEIDAATAPTLREAFDDLLDGGTTHLTVDLRRVDFVDSSGLSTLIVAAKAARRDGGDLRVVGTTPAVYRIFEVAGLDRVFTFVEPRYSRASGDR